MDIELGRTTSAVRDFLEDDLSSAHLGLTSGSRNVLDRFRSFLHSFYVDKFGYWPPPKGVTFSKALFQSLYFDFKTLYDYLVDSDSTADLASQKLASGGICVLQNVDSFDKRHRFSSLPHPLPLIPKEVSSLKTKRTLSQKTLKSMTIGTRQCKDERNLSARAALIMATNGQSEARIIQAYMRFERQCITICTEEKTCIADARKVRWLLIYGTLQYLVSALRAPSEVRDTEGPKYHLNCLVREPAQLQTATTSVPAPVTNTAISPIDKYIAELSGTSGDTYNGKPMAIEPDCQNYDYFSHTNTDHGSRRASVDVPAPLKVSQLSRASSVRSRRRLSLSALGSGRNNISLKQQSHCDIIIPGYGNGLNDAHVDAISGAPPRALSRTSKGQPCLTQRSSQATIGPDTSRLTPTTSYATPRESNQPLQELEICGIGNVDPMRTSQGVSGRRLEHLEIDDDNTSIMPQTYSPDSASSYWWSDGASSTSSMSSTCDEQLEAKLKPAEESGLLGGLVPIASSIFDPPPVVPVRHSSLPLSNSNHPSSATAFPAGTTDPYLDIGVAISDSTPSARCVLSTPIALTPMRSSSTDQKIGRRVSTSLSRGSSSLRKVVRDLPSASLSKPEKSSFMSGQDEWPIKASAETTGSQASTKTKREKRLSFWKR